MKLLDQNQKIVSENFYWLPDANGEYSGLQQLKNVELNVEVIKKDGQNIELILSNTSKDNPVSFFNRISVIDTHSGERALPVFYSDNYVSILPNTEKSVTIDLGALNENSKLKIKVQGWNTKTVELKLD